MGFLEILTLILVVAKLLNWTDISWLTVFSPLMVSAVFWLGIGAYFYRKMK